MIEIVGEMSIGSCPRKLARYTLVHATSEHYRKSAEECRRHAQETHDQVERETLLRMAAQWDRLAGHKPRKEWGKRKGRHSPRRFLHCNINQCAWNAEKKPTIQSDVTADRRKA
jgi:hypothetical protein